MPKVSVIIPHYNRPVLLLEAVESVLAQMETDFELIIEDDGSDIPLPEMPEDQRIRIIRKSHTGMPGEVRNRGAENASGDYIAFLDSDDLFMTDKLSRQLTNMELGEFRISHTRELWLRSGTTVSQAGQKHSRDGFIFADALKKCIIGPSTVMMEKSLFEETGGFDETLEIAEDYEYWLRITALYPVGYIDRPLTIKRAGSWDQLSEKYGQIEVFRIAGLKRLVDSRYFPKDLEFLAKAELARKCRIYAMGCRKREKPEEADQYENWAGIYEQGSEIL